MSNLFISVPAGTAMGEYDTVSMPVEGAFQREVTEILDPDFSQGEFDTAPVDTIFKQKLIQTKKVQKMRDEEVYTTDPDAIPEAVYKLLMRDRLVWVRGEGQKVQMPGTKRTGGRKLLQFLTDMNFNRINTIITDAGLDWEVVGFMPFNYTITKHIANDGTETLISTPKIKKALDIDEVKGFIPRQYSEYDDNGDGVPGTELPKKLSQLHRFSGTTPYDLEYVEPEEIIIEPEPVEEPIEEPIP